MVDQTDRNVFPFGVDLNPNLEVFKMFEQKDQQLSDEIRIKTKQIQQNSKTIKDLTVLMNILRDEYGIGIGADGKKINQIDFSNSAQFIALIDRLSEQDLIAQQYKGKYTYHNSIEIERFIAHIEGKIEEEKNKNEPNLLLIQPLLDLMKQLADIVKKINESNEKLLETTHKSL